MYAFRSCRACKAPLPRERRVAEDAVERGEMQMRTRLCAWNGLDVDLWTKMTKKAACRHRVWL